jgi:SAM-dependent methyltransferase
MFNLVIPKTSAWTVWINWFKKIGIPMFAVLVVISSLFLTEAILSNIIETKSSRYWFASELPRAEEVANWTEVELSNNLFRLSRWDGFVGNSQFRHFVRDQIEPLHMISGQAFYFLEVGVGVGAFAREILAMYPRSRGYGIDMVPGAIDIARAVLPASRMTFAVADMRHIEKESGSFDVIYVPGAICYLPTMDDVREAVKEFIRLLKHGGGLCLSMIASDDSDMGSCKTRISKTFWTSEVADDLRVLKLEEMDAWHLPHSFGRYSVCLFRT